MSNKIMALCWPLQVPLTAKSVLIALADHASDDGKCWPSLETLASHTCASRRAVVDAIKQLEQCHAITADRTNGRHTTYCVHPDRFVEVPGLVSARTATRRLTGANAARVEAHEPVQMPHGSDAPTGADAAPVEGRGPVQMPHPTRADAAPPPVQMPHQPVQMPHSNHQEPPFEPSRNPQQGAEGDLLGDTQPAKSGKAKKAEKFDAGGVALPAWLEREWWLLWVQDRRDRKKPLTEVATRLQIEQLGKYRAQGYAPKDVIENSIGNGYVGLFPPKTNALQRGGTAGRHSGFDQTDYREGVDENGRIVA